MKKEMKKLTSLMSPITKQIVDILPYGHFSKN